MKLSSLKPEVRVITPAEARELLGRNPDNRRLREGVVAKYARDMAAGHWHLTYDPIRLNGDGTLIDGQHRLQACVQSNKSFETLIVRGFSQQAKTVFDSGAPRSFGDVLRWQGELNVQALASVIRWCMSYEAGNERDPKFNLSHQEKLDWLWLNPGVRNAVAVGSTVCGHIRISSTVLAGVYYELTRIDQDDANAFFERLKDQSGLEKGSPILALRRWAERQSSQRDRPTPIVYAAFLIKAINAWREGKFVEILYWRPGGASAEPFPRLNER